MSAGFVKVTLIGNLGQDPEMRSTASGTAVCNISVGCNEKVKVGGNWEDHVEWMRVTCWGVTAENVGKYCSKGKQVFVEGRGMTKKWTDKDGAERSNFEVTADKVLFLGGGKQDGSAGKHDGGKPAPKSDGANHPPPLGDDDIPF